MKMKNSSAVRGKFFFDPKIFKCIIVVELS